MTDRPSFALQFGSLVHSRRKKRQLTLAELAALVGVHEQSVWRWEHGEQLPDAYDLSRLAAALGCAVRTILPRRNAAPATVAPDELDYWSTGSPRHR